MNFQATDGSYTLNPSYPDWIYDVWYEVTVKPGPFASGGIREAGDHRAERKPEQDGIDDVFSRGDPVPAAVI